MSERSEGERGTPQPGDACWHCGSPDLTRRVEVGQTAEVARIGLKFLAVGMLGIRAVGTEPLRATVCNACGTVVRLWVEVTGQEWCQADPL